MSKDEILDALEWLQFICSGEDHCRECQFHDKQESNGSRCLIKMRDLPSNIIIKRM